MSGITRTCACSRDVCREHGCQINARDTRPALGADEIPVGPDTETPEQIAARVRRETLEEAARFCEQTTMCTVARADKAQFVGSYVAGEYHPETGGRHHGMGYAAALRALIDKEPRT